MFVGLLALYVAVYRRFVFGWERVFHDTMWDHHAFYAVLVQWLDAGQAIGWNPYLNGGEPLYLYSNLFLWAELIGFVALNWLFGIPPHALINLYFTFIVLSFSTLCFVFFSVVFPARVVAFYGVIPVLFGGLTASTLAQYMLSPLYLLPVALLASYLLARDRDPVWLLALGFVCCVSANHYLPHYLVLSIAVCLVGFGVAAGIGWLGGRREGAAPARSGRLRAAGVAVGILISGAALAPAVFVHQEARDLISPTRGNVAVADGGIGVQPGVHQSRDGYKYLVRLPRIRPDDPSGRNLEYAHGVFYVGWVPVLLALGSIAACRRPGYGAFALALVLVALLAMGDGFVVWRLLKAYVPFFYVRHAYPLSLTVTVLLIVLSAFGLQRLVPWPGIQVLICVLTLALTLPATSRVHGDTRAPFDLAPMRYPVARAAYSEPVSRVPVDTGPLVTKRAAATHVNDDFILFRTRRYQDLLHRDLPFVTGPIFNWSRHLDWRSPDLAAAPSEVDNGSFEAWPSTGPPVRFEDRSDGSGSRVSPNRDRTWIHDGTTSARVDLSPGAAARLVYIHPRPLALRGRFFEVSACLASPAREPVAATLTLLQHDGYNILTPHTYRGAGGWECFRRGFLMADRADALEVVLGVSSAGAASVYLDRLDLRPFPESRAAGLDPVVTPRLVRGDPNRVTVHVDAPEDGYLLRKENYHRGWSAAVDGRAVPIQRYAGAFQAVALPRGAHAVEFTFDSPYPRLMWLHVAAVLVGYLALYGYLLRVEAGRVARPA